MKKPIIIILILLLFCFLYSEKLPAEHILFLGLVTSGQDMVNGVAMPKIEYHYCLHRDHVNSYYLTAGMGMMLFSLHFPLGAVYTYGQKNIILLGAYYNINIASAEWTYGQPGNSISAKVGYRRKTDLFENDSYFQIYFSPYFNLKSKELHPGIGVGLGIPL